MSAEEPVHFDSGGHRLYGILHSAGTTRDIPAVVFLPGWSGCRLGPHRMFVKTARRLSSMGFNCLRFDFAGRGDSEGDPARATIASMTEDTGHAMDFIQQRLGCSSFILLGICSGGKVAVCRASRDRRVEKLVLWSAEPMGGMALGMRRTRKALSVLGEYAVKLFDPGTWRRILAGRVNTRMVGRAVMNREEAGREEREAESAVLEEFRSFRGSVRLIYGSNDPETCMASQGYAELCGEAGIVHEVHRVEGANHSFYSLEWEKQVIDLTAAGLAVLL